MNFFCIFVYIYKSFQKSIINSKSSKYLGEEPLSVEEHNNLVMKSADDFLTTLESSRWNRIAIPMGIRPKEMTSMLYNI